MLILVLKDSLRTFQVLVLVLALGGQVLVLVLVLGGQVIVLVLVLGGQVLVLVLGGQVLVLVLGGQVLVSIPDRNTRNCFTSLRELFLFVGELQYTSDPVLIQTIKTRGSTERKQLINGLTILEKELFVLSDVEVEIFDSVKLSFSRRWNLKELIRPMDIGACNRNKWLYVYDLKGNCDSKEILRVDPNGKLINNWSTGIDYARGLSVTDESNVILTIYKQNKLNEYSPDGLLIRQINLSSYAGISHPWHAIKLKNGHFVVTHGSFDDDLHTVCILNADGKLMKSFRKELGTAIVQMRHPVYLSFDENGFMMVADQGNRRLLLLDSDLEFKKEVLSEEKHGLRHPRGIVLDESNGRLLVVDNELNNSRILVFDFK